MRWTGLMCLRTQYTVNFRREGEHVTWMMKGLILVISSRLLRGQLSLFPLFVPVSPMTTMSYDISNLYMHVSPLHVLQKKSHKKLWVGVRVWINIGLNIETLGCVLKRHELYIVRIFFLRKKTLLSFFLYTIFLTLHFLQFIYSFLKRSNAI